VLGLVVAFVVVFPIAFVPASFRWTIKEPRLLRTAPIAQVRSQNVLLLVGSTTTTANKWTIGRNAHRSYKKEYRSMRVLKKEDIGVSSQITHKLSLFLNPQK